MANIKDLSEKEFKKEMRRQKREAKYERRYGNPVMRKLAEADPSVARYYDRYKRANRDGLVSLWLCALFMLLGCVDILMLAFSSKDGWAVTFGIDVLFSFYWLADYKISDMKADLRRHEFVQYADNKAIEKLMREGFRDEEDDTKKTDK